MTLQSPFILFGSIGQARLHSASCACLQSCSQKQQKALYHRLSQCHKRWKIKERHLSHAQPPEILTSLSNKHSHVLFFFRATLHTFYLSIQLSELKDLQSCQTNRNNKNLYAQTGAPTFSPKEAVCSLLSEAVLSHLLPLFLLLPFFSLIVCHFYQLLIFYNFLLPYFLFSSIASSYVFLFLQVFAHKRLPKS